MSESQNWFAAVVNVIKCPSVALLWRVQHVYVAGNVTIAVSKDLMNMHAACYISVHSFTSTCNIVQLKCYVVILVI